MVPHPLVLMEPRLLKDMVVHLHHSKAMLHLLRGHTIPLDNLSPPTRVTHHLKVYTEKENNNTGSIIIQSDAHRLGGVASCTVMHMQVTWIVLSQPVNLSVKHLLQYYTQLWLLL